MSQVDEDPDYIQPPQESPGINMLFVMALLAGTLAAFAFSVLATYVVMRDRQATMSHAWPRVPERLGQPAFNEVNQLPFRLDTRAYQQQRDEERRLAGYGWVDRSHGVVHLPIDRAMDLELQQQPPRSAP